MKNIIATAFLFFVSTNLSAAPMYYTFEGIISMFSENGLSESGYSAGDTTSYTVMIDTDRKGEITNAGITTVYDDTSTYDIFYTDYITGDALPEFTYFEEDEHNLGYDRVLGGGIQDRLYIASDKRLFFWFDYETLNTLQVDDIGIFENYWTNDSNGLSYIRGNVFLKSISNANPINEIPSPTTLLLMLFGYVYLIRNILLQLK